MQVIITTLPEPLLTSADEIVRQSMGLDGTDKDDLVDSLLLAAQAELDGPKGWVGISVAQQSVEARFDAFDCPAVVLPGGPIIGDVVVTYTGSDGSEVTLDAATYLVQSDGTLSLVAGSSWPTLADEADAVRAFYDVGIENQDDPRIRLMKTAIILHAKMSLDFDDVDTRRKAIEALVRPMWVPVM